MRQEVCPFNVKFAEPAAEAGYAARGPGERPVGVEAMPEAEAVDHGTGSGDTGGLSAESGGGRSAGVSAGTPPAFEPRVPAEGPTHPGTDSPSLIELLRMALSEEAWEAFSRGSAIRRAGRAGFSRNVCVAIGNWLASEEGVPPEAVAVLLEALSDPEPLVRGHAAWALGRIRSSAANAVLEELAGLEVDDWVKAEIKFALESSTPTLHP